jgi:hypothetical protein
VRHVCPPTAPHRWRPTSYEEKPAGCPLLPPAISESSVAMAQLKRGPPLHHSCWCATGPAATRRRSAPLRRASSAVGRPCCSASTVRPSARYRVFTPEAAATRSAALDRTSDVPFATAERHIDTTPEHAWSVRGRDTVLGRLKLSQRSSSDFVESRSRC